MRMRLLILCTVVPVVVAAMIAVVAAAQHLRRRRRPYRPLGHGCGRRLGSTVGPDGALTFPSRRAGRSIASTPTPARAPR